MSWIKRNLFFFIGSIVALLLMGAAGWSLYSKLTLNNQILADLNTSYDELKGLTSKNPHPGDGKVNNIQIAKSQELQLSNFVAKARAHFVPIERLPSEEDAPKITDRDLTTALSRTIDQLQREAATASVTVISNQQGGYYFSFEALRGKVSFDQKGLLPLATQLGEVKAICDVLFQAKVNSLDNIRRERVAAEDSLGGLQTDYLTEKKTTNDLAVLTPYEITFKCFSSELASVLASFAGSPHAILVKTVNVEGAPVQAAQELQPGMAPGTPYAYQYQQPTSYVPPGTTDPDAQARLRSRYGLGGGGRGMGRYSGGTGALPGGTGVGVEYRGLQPQQPAYAPAVPQATVAPTGPKSGGLPTVLDERQLKVTMNLILVKLLPPKQK